MSGTTQVLCPRCQGETIPFRLKHVPWLGVVGRLMQIVGGVTILLFVIPALDPFGFGEAGPGWVLTKIKGGQSGASDAFKQAAFSSAVEEKLRGGPKALSVEEFEALSPKQREFVKAFEAEIANAQVSWFAEAKQSGRFAAGALVASLALLWLGGALVSNVPALACLRCKYEFQEFKRPPYPS